MCIPCTNEKKKMEAKLKRDLNKLASSLPQTTSPPSTTIPTIASILTVPSSSSCIPTPLDSSPPSQTTASSEVTHDANTNLSRRNPVRTIRKSLKVLESTSRVQETNPVRTTRRSTKAVVAATTDSERSNFHLETSKSIVPTPAIGKVVREKRIRQTAAIQVENGEKENEKEMFQPAQKAQKVYKRKVLTISNK